MPCCSCCCSRNGLYRPDRPILRMEPRRFHRWLLASTESANSDGKSSSSPEADARRLLADGSLAVQLKPTKVELRRMQSYSLWKVSMQLNHLLSWFQPSVSGDRRVVAIRQLEPLPPRFDTALRDAMPYLRAYFPCLDLQLLPDCHFLAGRKDVLRRLLMLASIWNFNPPQHSTVTPLASQEVKGSIRLEAGSVLRCLLNSTPCGDLQVAVCHSDLYPGPDMLGPGQTGAFILGQSSAMLKAAAICFGRGSSAPIEDADVLNDGDVAKGDPLINTDWRVRKVLSHELGHLLGLDHCCCYGCNMNGSESMAEALAQPLELCPLCLAKVCRLFRGSLSPSSWAESMLNCLWPEAYPEGSKLRDCVRASVDRLKKYSELDGLV